MKIVGSQTQQVLSAYLKRAGKAETAVSTPAPSDEVTVSSRAEEILKARQAYDQLPEVREDRVESIRQRIQDGTYQLSNDQIARAVLGQEQAAADEASDV